MILSFLAEKFTTFCHWELIRSLKFPDTVKFIHGFKNSFKPGSSECTPSSLTIFLALSRVFPNERPEPNYQQPNDK